MRFLSFLFGGKKKVVDQSLSSPTKAIRGDVLEVKPISKTPCRGRVQWREASFPMEVVGESNYQVALESICGRPTRYGTDLELKAVIELEPSNIHDPNAVVVRVAGLTVGYLSRDQAIRVGTQMREENLSAAVCGARVRGGWRTNQYDRGDYGVRLAMPSYGWIDFGIGTLPPPTSTRTRSAEASKTIVRPEAAATGPLKGHRVALQGTTSDGIVAQELAGAGAKIMASIGKSTTLLVVDADEPFSSGIKRSATYRKAETMIAEGKCIKILSVAKAREIIAAG